MKKFILNADNFGASSDFNRGVLNGYNGGFLKSASLVANGKAFDTAINEILPECQHLSVGVHLNILYGKPLTKCLLLTKPDCDFKNTFTKLEKVIKKKGYLNEIEKEFRAQIEKVQKYTQPDHIDSVGFTHAIPEIFNLVCKLADEYKIPYVRNHYEEFYLVPKVKYMLNYRFWINLPLLSKLNFYSSKNINTLKSYALKTNKYFIGTEYKGLMNKEILEAGLKTLADEDEIIVEASINPCSYLRNQNDSYSLEFKMTQDKILEDTICRMGYDITNHKV